MPLIETKVTINGEETIGTFETDFVELYVKGPGGLAVLVFSSGNTLPIDYSYDELMKELAEMEGEDDE